MPVVQPGHSAHDPFEAAQDAHDANEGVPEHDGPTRNWRGAGGSLRPAVRQQIWPVQSSFFSHDLAQVLAQVPLQQSWPVVLQSAEVVHDLGHGSTVGLRQMPVPLSEGSSTLADVQQISPLPVSHSELAAQALGHLLAGRQMDCE
jgi:hypothetical protein